MVKLIPAIQSDFEHIKLKEIYEHKEWIIYGQHAIGSGSPGLSIVTDDGDILGVVGGIFIHPGVMEVFGLFGEDIKKHKLSFHKEVKLALEEAFEKHNVHRIQIVVRADYEQGIDWAHSLGFQFEGLMSCYGPTKKDYLLYARVK